MVLCLRLQNNHFWFKLTERGASQVARKLARDPPTLDGSCTLNLGHAGKGGEERGGETGWSYAQPIQAKYGLSIVPLKSLDWLLMSCGRSLPLSAPLCDVLQPCNTQQDLTRYTNINTVEIIDGKSNHPGDSLNILRLIPLFSLSK